MSEKNTKSHLSRLTWLLCGTAAVVASPALAQSSEENSGLKDIVVTAQKREQNLLDVPLAVSALSAETLEANRIQNVVDLNSITPGLVVSLSPGGLSAPFYSLRGLYNTGGNPGADRGTGLYIDGVYIASPQGSVFNMPNVERIEVLRGPQGTLFGRNSTGGAISIVTREPTGEFGVKQKFTYGNRDLLESVTTVDTPSFGPLSASINYVHSQQRGDIRNLGAGTVWDYGPTYGKPTLFKSPKWLGGGNRDSIFASIKADFDDVKFVYRFDYTDERNVPEGAGFVYAGPAMRDLYALLAVAQPNAKLTPVTTSKPSAVNNAPSYYTKTKVRGHSLTGNFTINDQVSLKTITAYRHHKADAPATDVFGFSGFNYISHPLLDNFTSPAAARVIGAPFAGIITNNVQDTKQFSQELQLNVDTEQVTFTGGAIYFRARALSAYPGVGGPKNAFFGTYPNYAVPSFLQPNVSGGQTTNLLLKSRAIYAQAEVHVTPELDIVGGTRYTKDTKDGIDRTVASTARPNAVFPINYSGDKVTYSIGVNVKPAEDILVYFKHSTGYVSGGSLSTVDYSPETVSSIDAGIKGKLFDNTVSFDLALYLAKYKNLLFNASARNLPAFAAIAAQGVGTLILNAGDTRVQGVEFEGSWAPVRGVLFTGNVGYMDFKYTRLESYITQGTAAYLEAGRPKWTGAFSAQYTSPPVFDDAFWTVRMDGNYRSNMIGPGSSVPLIGAFGYTIPSVLQAGRTIGPFDAAEQALLRKALNNKPRWIWNGRVALEKLSIGGADATLALWGRNLFNKQSTTFRSAVGFGVAAYWEPDRSYGLDLTVEF